MGHFSMTLIEIIGLFGTVALMAAVVYWIALKVIGWVTLPEWNREALARASDPQVGATDELHYARPSRQWGPGILAVVLVVAFAGAWQALTTSETLSVALIERMAQLQILQDSPSTRVRPSAEEMEKQLRIVRELEDQLRRLSMQSATMLPRTATGTGGPASLCAPRHANDGIVVSCSQLISKSSPQLRSQILREWRSAQ
jgi:hypothetical protein